MGLHCVSASVDVGNAVLTASSALLSALGTVAAISKQSKAAAGPVQHVKSSPSKLTAAAFDRIVASLPDQVGCTNSYISLHLFCSPTLAQKATSFIRQVSRSQFAAAI